MRVGIFSPGYPGVSGTGGIAVYTHSLATGLVGLGHEVHVLVHGEPARLVRDGVNLHLMRPRHARGVSRWLRGGRESFETSLAALRLARRHRLDVFEFPNFDGMGVPFRELARVANGPPVVVRLHTSLAECLAIDGTPIRAAERFEVWRERVLCTRAHALTVSTHAHRRHMAGELGIPEERMAILPLGLPDLPDPALRAPRPRAAAPTIVYVGRLEPRKGVIDLLQAVPRVLAAVPEARFILIGNDRPLAPGGTTHAEWLRANLPPAAAARVELTGFVDDARRQELVERADVFVAPSLYESFGLIFLEAMRVAVPVVGTTAGGIPEVVHDGATGLLVPPQRPERIAAALLQLLGDEPLRLRLAAAGRRRFEERFSSRVMAERTVLHHQALLARVR